MPNTPTSCIAGAHAIVADLKAAGVEIVATVPDAWLTATIAALAVEDAIKLVRVAREDEGVGICSGAFPASKRAVLLARNAGLLLSVNALAGMALNHHIPVLMLQVDRGGIDNDQFFQSYKGRVTRPVLDALGIPWHRLNDTGKIPTLCPSSAPGAARPPPGGRGAVAGTADRIGGMNQIACARAIAGKLAVCSLGSVNRTWRSVQAPMATYYCSDPMGLSLSIALGVALAMPLMAAFLTETHKSATARAEARTGTRRFSRTSFRSRSWSSARSSPPISSPSSWAFGLPRSSRQDPGGPNGW